MSSLFLQNILSLCWICIIVLNIIDYDLTLILKSWQQKLSSLRAIYNVSYEKFGSSSSTGSKMTQIFLRFLSGSFVSIWLYIWCLMGPFPPAFFITRMQGLVSGVYSLCAGQVKSITVIPLLSDPQNMGFYLFLLL